MPLNWIMLLLFCDLVTHVPRRNVDRAHDARTRVGVNFATRVLHRTLRNTKKNEIFFLRSWTTPLKIGGYVLCIIVLNRKTRYGATIREFGLNKAIKKHYFFYRCMYSTQRHSLNERHILFYVTVWFPKKVLF